MRFYRRIIDFLSRNLGLAALIGFAAAVIAGAVSSAGQDCRAVSDGVVRLRVIANSDAPVDQAVKLCVRDAVVREADALLREAEPSGREDAARVLLEHADVLTSAAERELSDRGFAYGACVRLRTERFPVRRYGDRLLPAGTYESVCVELGEGRGQNWWCVLFPRLCLPAVTEDWQGLPDVTDAGHISVRVALWDWIQQLLQRK